MIKIRIVEDMKKYDQETNKYIKDVLAEKIPIDKERAKETIILTPEGFARMFSPEKVRLMLRIRKNHITNIYQLAKELGRRYESVHRDITYLEGFNLIKIKTTKDKKKIPYINDKITINSFA